jgi:hypothetical protein
LVFSPSRCIRFFSAGITALAVAGMLASPAAAAGSPAATPAGTVTLPKVPAKGGVWSFDIGWVDSSGTYYLADRTNGLDVVNPKSNTATAVIPGFVGAKLAAGKVDNDHSGPNGVVTVDSRNEAWLGDGDSTVKVVDLNAGSIVASIPTGGSKRADELAYDAKDGVILIANDADDPPFLTFLSVADRSVLAKVPYPNATNGIEQPVWNPANDKFYVAIPQTKANKGGEIDMLDPIAMSVSQVFPVSDCVPHGLALGPNQQLLLGCSGDAINLLNAHAQSQIMDAATGQIVAKVMDIGGSDEVWYSPAAGQYYLAASSMTSDGTKKGKPAPALGIIDAYTNTWVGNIPTSSGSHSVAADPATGKIFVPQPEKGLGMWQPGGLSKGQSVTSIAQGSTTGGARNYMFKGDGSLVTLTLTANGGLDPSFGQAVGLTVWGESSAAPLIKQNFGKRVSSPIFAYLGTDKGVTYTIQVFDYQPGSTVNYTLSVSS